MRQGEKACPEGCTEWFSGLVKNPFETPEPLIEKRRDESMIKCLIVCLILLLSNPAIAHADSSAAPFPAYDEKYGEMGLYRSKRPMGHPAGGWILLGIPGRPGSDQPVPRRAFCGSGRERTVPLFLLMEAQEENEGCFHTKLSPMYNQ